MANNPNIVNPSDHPGRYVASMTGALTVVGGLIALGARSKNPIMVAVTGACYGLIFSTVHLGVEHYRRKDDKWNLAIGLGVATSFYELAFGPHLRPLYRFPVAAAYGVASCGLAFAGLSLLDKYYQARAETKTSD